MKKWECGTKESKSSTYYKIVFALRGLQSIKPVEDFESSIGFVEFIDNSKAYATVKVLNR